MKHLLIMLLAAAVMALPAAAADEKAAPGEKLGFKILAELCEGEKGALISPYSLYTALNMAAEGARGATLDEILAALDTDMPTPVEISSVKSSNAAFISDNAGVIGAYLDALAKYGAARFDLDPANIDGINRWASEATGGLIDPFLTEPLDPNTRLALLNAISLDAKWDAPFDKSDTYDEVFHAPTGDAEKPFIHGTREMLYGETDDGALLGVLDYEGGLVKAYFVLPQKGETDAALDMLVRDGYSVFDGTAFSTVRLAIPKLDVDFGASFAGVLKDNGVVSAFSNDADFSGVNGQCDLMISDVMQRAVLKLDEEGTKAAAVTQATMSVKSVMMPDEIKALRLDRPFILLIRDETTGQTLFAGLITEA